MDRQNGSRARGDRVLDEVGVNIEIFPHITEDGLRADVDNCRSGSHKGVSGYDYLIARTNSSRPQ